MGLGGGRVADHEHVDVATDVGPVREVLFVSAEEKEEDGLLDLVVAVYRGSEGLGEQFEDVVLLAFGELVDGADVGVGERGLGDAAAGFGGEENDVVRDYESSVCTWLVSIMLTTFT